MEKRSIKENINVFVSGNGVSYSRLFPNHLIVNDLKKADIVMFTGGEDVSPLLYGDTVHPSTHYNVTRDENEEKDYWEALSLQLPMLGICRGAQFLTVMNGGKLIQNVDNHGKMHKIFFANYKEGVEPLTPYFVNSTHHQMMYPYNLDPRKYKLIAFADNQASKYEVGLNHKDLFNFKNLKPKEPEIVFYPESRCLAIQYHPEAMVGHMNISLRDSLKKTYDVIEHTLLAEPFKHSKKQKTDTVKVLDKDFAAVAMLR